MEDDIVSLAFGMLCAHIPSFKSELNAAHVVPLAINEWLYCNEDILVCNSVSWLERRQIEAPDVQNMTIGTGSGNESAPNLCSRC